MGLFRARKDRTGSVDLTEGSHQREGSRSRFSFHRRSRDDSANRPTQRPEGRSKTDSHHVTVGLSKSQSEQEATRKDKDLVDIKGPQTARPPQLPSAPQSTSSLDSSKHSDSAHLPPLPARSTTPAPLISKRSGDMEPRKSLTNDENALKGALQSAEKVSPKESNGPSSPFPKPSAIRWTKKTSSNSHGMEAPSDPPAPRSPMVTNKTSPVSHDNSHPLKSALKVSPTLKPQTAPKPSWIKTPDHSENNESMIKGKGLKAHPSNEKLIGDKVDKSDGHEGELKNSSSPQIRRLSIDEDRPSPKAAVAARKNQGVRTQVLRRVPSSEHPNSAATPQAKAKLVGITEAAVDFSSPTPSDASTHGSPTDDANESPSIPGKFMKSTFGSPDTDRRTPLGSPGFACPGFGDEGSANELLKALTMRRMKTIKMEKSWAGFGALSDDDSDEEVPTTRVKIVPRKGQV